MGDRGVLAVVVVEEQAAVLVAEQQQLALGVVIHRADLVLQRRGGIGYGAFPLDGVLLDLQFL